MILLLESFIERLFIVIDFSIQTKNQSRYKNHPNQDLEEKYFS